MLNENRDIWFVLWIIERITGRNGIQSCEDQFYMNFIVNTRLEYEKLKVYAPRPIIAHSSDFVNIHPLLLQPCRPQPSITFPYFDKYSI